DQLAGELLDRLARAALEQQPGLAAELREGRRLAVGADVARDLADLLVGNVEPVVAAEGDEEVVAGDAGDLFRLEPEQPADAMVLVHDVVAGAQVGERLQRSAQSGVASRRPLAKDLRVRQEDETELAPDEAAPGRRNREVQPFACGGLGSLLEPFDGEPAEEGRRPEAVAAVREGDDDPLAGAHEGRQLLLRLGEAAGGDSGPLPLKGEGLAARKRVEER